MNKLNKTTLTIALASAVGLGFAGQSASAATIAGQLGVLNATALASLSEGDQYRLVFVTSTAINSTATGTNNSTDIAVYDAVVQSFANTAGYGTVAWQVIGSTAAVDAIDHTNTTSGTGVPIYLFDGQTIFATSYTDLWNGSGGGIDFDENGNATSITSQRAWTGTAGSGGTGIANGLLGAADNTVVVGDLTPSTSTSWGNVFQENYTTFNAGLYGISEVLTVVPVPEPSSTALLGLGGLALILRRRRK